MFDRVRYLSRVRARYLRDRVGLAYNEQVFDLADVILRFALGGISSRGVTK